MPASLTCLAKILYLQGFHTGKRTSRSVSFGPSSLLGAAHLLTGLVEDVKLATVSERVIDIVAEQLGGDKEKITTETSFVNDLGADSLDTVELVMELEEEFDIDIPEDAAEKIQTVGQAIDYIEKSQAAS